MCRGAVRRGEARLAAVGRGEAGCGVARCGGVQIEAQSQRGMQRSIGGQKCDESCDTCDTYLRIF